MRAISRHLGIIPKEPCGNKSGNCQKHNYNKDPAFCQKCFKYSPVHTKIKSPKSHMDSV